MKVMVRVLKAVFAFALPLLFAGQVLAEDTPALMDIRAEYVWRELYFRSDEKKAMAAAANGAIGIAASLSDQEEASRLALERCTEQSKFFALRNPPPPECQVFSVGKSWISQTLTPDPDWQKPLPGKDIPMKKGRKHLVPKSKGIILFVHGCNGLGDRIFTDIWGAYFNVLGFDFYAPDSFAVKRPKDVCGTSIDYPPEQVSKVWRLRIAQTQRSLADLSAANPKKPIYLFGHSEGGLIVQMIQTDIAGIIVAGEECGVFGAPVAASANVPLLYLWGEYDRFVNGVGLQVTDASGKACADDIASHKPRFAILKDRSHIPWPWIDPVNASVAGFLGTVPPAMPRDAGLQKSMASAWKRTKPVKRYRQASGHRAAAINSRGTSYMVWGLDNEEDARQLALFSCSRASSKGNVFSSGKFACSVTDIDGKPRKQGN